MVIKMCWKSILQKYEKDIVYLKYLQKYFRLSIPGPRQRLVTTQQLQRARPARCLVASVGTDSRCVDIRLESDDTCYLWTEFEIIKMFNLKFILVKQMISFY